MWSWRENSWVTKRIVCLKKVGWQLSCFPQYFGCRRSCLDSPGQSERLHGISWRSEPTQLRPPYFGAGLLHRRMRSLFPAPQEEEQKLHMLQAAQFPWTTEGNTQIFSPTNCLKTGNIQAILYYNYPLRAFLQRCHYKISTSFEETKYLQWQLHPTIPTCPNPKSPLLKIIKRKQAVFEHFTLRTASCIIQRYYYKNPAVFQETTFLQRQVHSPIPTSPNPKSSFSKAKWLVPYGAV